MRLAVGQWRDGLPQFLGDERNQRMGQAQHGLEYAYQRPPSGARFLLRTLLDLNLGEFQVPVAELIPDEFVDGAGQQVEAVVSEMLRHIGFGALQAADDPAVGE